jgi:hypothetical protein
MTMKTLHCQAGNHEWQRAAQRGRLPLNCPEHTEEKVITGTSAPVTITGIQAAHAAKANKKSQEEQEWSERVESVIRDPRMTVSVPDRYSTDARPHTVSKLRYIQDQLTNHRAERSHNDLADLEKMRAKIMQDPFSRSGHLY